jgi:hypothetical protein
MSEDAPRVFFSYARRDEHEGDLTDLRRQLEDELQRRVGLAVRIFADRDIVAGERWEMRLADEIATSALLIAIVSPSYLRGEMCRREVETFLRARPDGAVVPVQWIATSPTELGGGFANLLAARQAWDWTRLRDEAHDPSAVRRGVMELATAIAPTLRRPPLRRPQPPAADDGAGPLSGRWVLVTGALAAMTRAQADDAVRRADGRPVTTVSRRTTLVVAGRDPGIRVGQADARGIPIIDEPAFLAILRGERPAPPLPGL